MKIKNWIKNREDKEGSWFNVVTKERVYIYQTKDGKFWAHNLTRDISKRPQTLTNAIADAVYYMKIHQ